MAIMLGLHLRFVSVLFFVCAFASSFFMLNALGVGLSACLPNQIQTLMEFKSEFDSSSCNQSDFFNGVWCDNATGAVTELQLPRGCLSGVLKPKSSLFELHHLRYLDLSQSNFISSSLPSEFGNLNKLEVLFLSSGGLQGQVPSSLSNLTMLSHLDLSHNELTGSFPLVQNLTKLSILSLSYNNFSGAIPSCLLTMPFLSILDLNTNHLTGSIEVPNSSFSARLRSLHLGNNHFKGQILEPISKLITLKYLYLPFLNISYPIDLKIFSSLKSLLRLNLIGNRISAASLSLDYDIPLNLEFLALSGCDISEFPNILKIPRNLSGIDMSQNRIKGEIPRWLWNLPRLGIVSLFNNSFTGFEGSSEVLVNSSVRFLDIQANNFKGEFLSPPLLINQLLAWGNSFTGNIPLSICNRSSLIHLDLSYNNFTGPIPQCLSNFKIVILRKNNLKGSLPDMFSVDSSLRTLDVGYNQLTGKLPKSLLKCSPLHFLSVDHNKIKDTFPFWLKSLPNLQALILRSNKFYGPISPPDRGSLAFPELSILEVAENNFNGSLPPSYFLNWKASSVKTNEDGSIYMGYYKETYENASFIYEDTLDLQYKGLRMEQERVITSYSTIDFSGNRLEGRIPESIGLLKTLIALNLSNNAFTGHIPMSLANVKELESLDLSRNQLSGTIPKGLETLSFLAYINVSNNKLKGEIPQGPQIVGQCKSSFEGNAGLCGLPLKDSCFGSNAPTTQPPKEEDKEEKEVLNWKAVAIGYGPGVLIGLAIAQVIASYKSEWLNKIIGPTKRIIR